MLVQMAEQIISAHAGRGSGTGELREALDEVLASRLPIEKNTAIIARKLIDQLPSGAARPIASAHELALASPVRFPAFWGGSEQWFPDQVHSNAASRALQEMLLRNDGDRVVLFPAWPKNWDVEFRLAAARNTVVEGVYRGGAIVHLKVTPPSRNGDIVKQEPR